MSKKKPYSDDLFKEENRKRKNLFKQQKRRELEESLDDDLDYDYKVYKFLREKG